LSYRTWDRLPPGVYELSVMAYRRGTSGALRPRELAAYSLFWSLMPDPATPPEVDAYEVDDVPLFATLTPQGFGALRTLHSAADVDHFRMVGFAAQPAGRLALDGYFQITETRVPLRLTLLDGNGLPTGVQVESDPDCSQPLGLHIPPGPHIVRVQALSGGLGWYLASYGRGVAGVWVPHAPLKWEVRHGIPVTDALFDPVAHHLFVPTGPERTAQLLASGVGLALRDADNALVAEGRAVPGFDGLVLPLQDLQPGQIYWIELRHPEALPGDSEGGVSRVKLPALDYKLLID
jgi:hypothetical protein